MSFNANREFERISWAAWCEDCDFTHDGPQAPEQAQKHATLTGHTTRDSRTEHCLCNPVPNDEEGEAVPFTARREYKHTTRTASCEQCEFRSSGFRSDTEAWLHAKKTGHNVTTTRTDHFKYDPHSHGEGR